MNRLHLTYLPDDDWHGELQAHVEAFGFVGRGSAWFNRERLLDFADGVKAYPIPAGQPVVLSDEIVGPGGKRQHHEFRLAIEPVSGAGALVVEIALVSHPNTGAGYLRQHCRVSFPIEYASLDRFRVAFINMLDDAQSVELKGSET